MGLHKKKDRTEDQPPLETLIDPKKGQPSVKRARWKKSLPSSAVEPITWHQGWEKINSSADEDPTETDANAPESGGRTYDSPGDNQPGFRVKHRVELSTEPPRLRRDGSTERQYLSASLEQPDGDKTAPVVLIGHNESSVLAATLDEAHRFALEILALVDKHEL
jgi:hypothetical protein